MVTINLNLNNFSELPILSEVFGSYDNSYEYTADEIFRKKASSFCPKCNSPMVHNGYNIYGKNDLGDIKIGRYKCCLLYTSDAADEEDSVDIGGRRVIKKKRKRKKNK